MTQIRQFPWLFTLMVSALLASTALAQQPAINDDTSETAGDAGKAIASSVPSNDIYLTGLIRGPDGYTVRGLINITDRPGYDNQPAFVDEGIVYTSIRDGEQSDIYRYDLLTGTHVQVTDSPESEYSPTPLPNKNGLSVVRVELDGTQRLWTLRDKKSDVLLPNVRNVGYHGWLTLNKVALFIVGESNTLVVADTQSGTVTELSENIGRSLQKLPREEVITFVDKTNDDEWFVTAIDLNSNEQKALVKTPDGSEDFVWVDDFGLFMAQAKKLFYWQRGSVNWVLVHDFGESLPGGITRMAIDPSGNHLALVVDEGN